jgi:hypothetical protein
MLPRDRIRRTRRMSSSVSSALFGTFKFDFRHGDLSFTGVWGWASEMEQNFDTRSSASGEWFSHSKTAYTKACLWMQTKSWFIHPASSFMKQHNCNVTQYPPSMASIAPTMSVFSMVGRQSEYTRLYCVMVDFSSGKVSSMPPLPSLSARWQQYPQHHQQFWLLLN